MHDALIDRLQRIVIGDRGQLVRHGLVSQDGAGRHVATVGDGHAHDDATRLDDAAFPYPGPEDEYLHSLEGVVENDGGAVDLDLVGERHAVAHVGAVFLAVHFHQVLLHGLAVLFRLEGVDHDAVLDVGIVAHVKGLALVAADGRKGRHEDVFPDDDVPDNGPHGVHVCRGINRGLTSFRTEICLYAFSYHLYLPHYGLYGLFRLFGLFRPEAWSWESGLEKDGLAA